MKFIKKAVEIWRNYFSKARSTLIGVCIDFIASNIAIFKNFEGIPLELKEKIYIVVRYYNLLPKKK